MQYLFNMSGVKTHSTTVVIKSENKKAKSEALVWAARGNCRPAQYSGF